MSELERAAAEHLRAQKVTAEREERQYAEAQQAAERAAQDLRRRALEFFTFARAHEAPLFRRYDLGDDPDNSVDTRTGDECVVAAQWHQTYFSPEFAVTAEGAVYTVVFARAKDRRRGIRDDKAVATSGKNATSDNLTRYFTAAAAALLESVWVGPDNRTGVQTTGWIGYRL